MLERLNIYLACISRNQPYEFIEEIFDFMRVNGSSITLTWDEDTTAWVCSWVSSGTRFTGTGISIHKAIHKTLIAFKEKH